MSRDREEILAELSELRDRQARLESELAGVGGTNSYSPVGYYSAYHIISGSLLGFFAATFSLVFNIIGATMVGKHPLEIVRIYLTFPMGDTALSIDNSSTLAIGCFLYLGTGMLLGALLHVILTKWFSGGTLPNRLATVSGLVLLLWVINHYALILWLQPLLFGGSWILDGIPWWVAASTHLVFGWSMLLMEPWGRFDRR
jgi:hypothetical protein